MPTGYLNVVLHAHLPFVRHPDRDDYLEQRWLFEAVCESYIPLLQVFQRLHQDGVDFRVTISLSSPLISMLTDSLIQSRIRKHLGQLISLADAEVERTQGDSQFHPLACEYRRRFQESALFFDRYHGNLISAFAALHATGKVELITSAATHAFLPYVSTDEAIRAQIMTAMELFEHHFGTRPKGMWLPECAYVSRLNPWLKNSGIQYFFVDSHGLESASPRPVFGTYAPVVTETGVAAFARDPESSRQVWDRDAGYPGDFDYREYYRDIGYDLDGDYVGPYIHPEGIRVNTGFKYYRITGKDGYKEPYDFTRARERAAIHAGNFMFNRQQQVKHAQGLMGRIPIITAPYDAELYGHWWYEGPTFLDMLFRKIHYDQSELKPITPSEYLAFYSDFQSCQLSMSTWGRDGFGDVWLNQNNDWIYPVLHDCEHQMIRMATEHRTPSPIMERALNQSCRELMLAQSSDWAFIMDAKTMVEYAVRRTKHHVNRFRALSEMIDLGEVDERYLSQLEEMDNLFPEVNYRIYTRLDMQALQKMDHAGRPRILMLSWEFPPMTVGGLSRHVYDVSRHLVAMGWDVHVITTALGDYPLEEDVMGVHVHRVRVLQPDGGSFIHFVLQLNFMMLDVCRKLFDAGLSFDILHAHDWLVCDVATALKERYRLPLVATMHATEHGRNQGIYTDTQRHIHQLEWELTYQAQRVVVCSSYMQREIQTVFELPAEKIHIIPNGVDKHLLQSPSHEPQGTAPFRNHGEPVVLFIGRLVQEKGVQVLLNAAPSILGEFPNTRFVVIGKGPMLESLTLQAEQLGVRHRVEFKGFVDDDERNRLFAMATVAVFPSLYEPFGIVTLEAMAAGTPVVVSNVGGLTDIVEHNHNGLKSYPNDAASIAEQVKRVLRSPEFALTLSNMAESELNRYHWETIARNTTKVYEQLLCTPQVVAALH